MQSDEKWIVLARPDIHRNRPVLKLYFRYIKEIIDKVRSIEGVLWSNSMKCWYVPDNAKTLAKLHSLEGITVTIESKTEMLTDKSIEKVPQLLVIRYHKGRIRLIFSYETKLIALIKTLPFYYYDAEGQWWTLPHLESVLEVLKEFCRENKWRFEYKDEWAEKKVLARKKDQNESAVCPEEFINKLKILRYSENTVRNYSSAIKEYIGYFHDKKLIDLGQEDVERFLLYLGEERKVSTSYLMVSISAIKFYYEKVMNMPNVTYHLKHPRGERLLPEVLSEDEVIKLFSVIKNFRHKCILMTIYSGGLRLSEVVNLKVSDIDSKRMMMFIRGAKGKKDRYTLLSKQLVVWLREYYQKEKPGVWLFEGATGHQFSCRSVQEIMHEAVKKAGIKKHATVHTLRHSFATHMLENGTDLRYIQNLMGHYSSKTTEIYTHITTKGLEQLSSPLDKLNIVYEKPDVSGK